MDNLISVIIPVYNVEKYIRKCLNSVVNQTYKELEIILIDDGSPDNCGAICDEYAQKDSRIRVIHKENGGVSSARNAGLDIANGEYISFIDPDDYISIDMYEYLMEYNDDFDIIEYAYYSITLDNKQIPRKILECDYDKYEDMLYGLFSKKLALGITKIYKKQVIGDLRFDTNYVIAEDTLFFVNCCKKAANLRALERPVYYYVHHNESAFRKGIYSGVFDEIKVLEKIRYECTESSLSNVFHFHYGTRCMDILFRAILNGGFNSELKSLINVIRSNAKKFLKVKPFMGMYGIQKLSWKLKVYIILLCIFPTLVCRLYYFRSRKINE